MEQSLTLGGSGWGSQQDQDHTAWGKGLILWLMRN